MTLLGFGIAGFLLVFNLLKDRTRQIVRLLASGSVALVASIVVFLLSLLGSSGWRLAVGIFTSTVIVCLAIFEVVFKIVVVLENKVGNIRPASDDKLQMKAASFYRSYDEVKNLEAVLSDPSITEQYWNELQSYRLRGMFKRDKAQTILGNTDNVGINLNVVDGKRITPGSPNQFESRCMVFGASGVFAYEVPDSGTPTAWLQDFLNKNHLNIRVENHGVGGATIQDCFRRLKLVDIGSKDIAVFIFGGNDVGVNTLKKAEGKGIFKKIPFWGPAIRLLESYSGFAEVLFAKTIELVFTDLESNHELLDSVKETIVDINNYVKVHNAFALFILQPNLFTKNSHSEYEVLIKNRYPKHWERTVLDGYKVLWSKLDNNENVVFGGHIFDDEKTSPYLDWGHVNSSGNRIIGRFIFENITKWKLT